MYLLCSTLKEKKIKKATEVYTNGEQESETMSALLSKSKNSINEINKSDVVEIKAIGNPPSAFFLVADAVCILFGQSVDFNFFKRMLASSDFQSSLINYDADKITEKQLQKLEKYINDPLFTPDYLRKVSRLGGSLCSWTRCMYEYGVLKNRQYKTRTTSKECSNLIEYVAKNSCYSFGWPCFYLDMYGNGEQIEKINSIIETKQVNLMPFLSYQDYFDQWDTSPELNELVVTNFSSLPFRILTSNVSKVSKFL